ncbi:hypothetical protein Tco_1465739 [Tanacetum coccineum]
MKSHNELFECVRSMFEEFRQREQAANLSTHTPKPSRRFNFIYDEDDDDEESTIPLNEITSQIPPSIEIIPVLPTLELGDSLIMGDENLSTIPEKESDEFIKSSIKDLVLIIKIKSNVSTDFEDDYYDSEGDIIYLESLLIKDTIPNLPPEVFLDRDPRSLKDEPDNDELKSMVKVFDPEIHEKIISLTYVRLPFEDRHYFSLTFAIRIFLPYLTYSKDSSLLLSSRSEDTIFDLDISIFSCYSLEPVVSHRSGTFMCFNVYLNILNESPMEIFSSMSFVLKHDDSLNPFVEIPSGESKVHIEVLSVLWGNRLPIPDGSLLLSRNYWQPKKQGHNQSFSSTSALPQEFEMGESSHKTSLDHHEEQIEEIPNHLDELPLNRIEQI